MVQASRITCAVTKGLYTKTKFLDRLRVYAHGGSGGHGLPRYGGLGGDGGDVVIVAADNDGSVRALSDVQQKYPKQRFVGGAGECSRKSALIGQRGQDCVLTVPVGICVKSDGGVEIGDLIHAGDTLVVARGGRGGGPSNSFLGSAGEARMLRLDLKLLADVGLVGFPNAGKSTLLKAISRASPKIANYPFTTVHPQLGTVEYEDGRQVTVADLPGLIEGAHANVGMGHSFLRHVERTGLLLVVVDASGFEMSPSAWDAGRQKPRRTAFETVVLLNKELELYKPELLTKRALLVVNKMDVQDNSKVFDEVLRQLNSMHESVQKLPQGMRPTRLLVFDDVLPVSAEHGTNIASLKRKLRDSVDLADDDSDPTRTKLREQLRERLEREVTVVPGCPLV